MHRKPALTLLYLTIIALVAATSVHASQPPRPGEIEHLKANGELEKRLAKADAMGNHLTSPNLIERFRTELAKMGLIPLGEDSGSRLATEKALPPAKQGRGLPSTGDLRTFTLLIEFDGYPHQIGRDHIDSMLYGEGDPDHFPRESLKNYYDRSSYGLANMSNGTTFAWFNSSYDRDSLDWGDAEDVIMEAITYFDDLGHDFSQYDNDGDGDIDYLIVFWTGPNNGWMNFWWAYRAPWDTDHSFQVDGKDMEYYSWQWESSEPDIVIHETGHGFGLPDLYDYDGDLGPDGGVGNFDMMDSNAFDHNCFSKWMLGWLQPTVVSNGNQNLTLDDTASSPECVLIWPGVSTSDIFSEFFLVQNRQSVGNDTSYSARDGLAIWHIDSTLASNWTFLFNNSYTPHKLVRLMEADGHEDIEAFGYGEPDDLYGPGDVLFPGSTPSSDDYSGYDSCVGVSNIADNGAAAGATISADFSITCSCPTMLSRPEHLAPADEKIDVSSTPTLNWEWVSGSTSFGVEVCDDPDCLQVQLSAVVTGNYWVVTPALEENQLVYWRVRAFGDCDASGWSEAWSFRTICEAAPPAVPELTEPVNSAVDVEHDVKLRWDYDPLADWYDVNVCADPACTTVIRSPTVPPFIQAEYWGNHWSINPDLEGGTQYWWRVRANSLCGPADWSATWSFTTHPSTGVPTLLEPDDNATNVELEPTLRWQAVPGATQYNLQICVPFDMECSDHENNYLPPTNEMTIYPLDEETSYPWRVRATSAWGYGEWSEIRVMHTCSSVGSPSTASVSPADGSVDVPLAPMLDWEPRDGGDFYDVEICTDVDCSQVIQSKTTFFTYWPIETNLPLGTQLWWRLRSNNPCGPSEWTNTTSPLSFTTTSCQTPLSRPYPHEPFLGSFDISVAPTLEWGGITGNVAPKPSEVQVCSDPNCSTVIRTVSLPLASQWQVTPELDMETQYWWRVRWFNDCGPGAWSDISTFTTEDCPAPASPIVSRPAATTPSGVSYTVDWSAVPGAVSYRVQESTDASFPKGAITSQTVTGSSASFSHDITDCTDTQYFYRVRSNGDCAVSAWSSPVDVTVESAGAPAAPAGLSPADGAVGWPPTLTLDWDDVDGAAAYDVIVCERGRCPTALRSFTVRDSDWTVTPALDPFTSYSWQVRGSNGCGDGEWSVSRDFTTGCAVPDSPAPADPGEHVASGVSYDLSWPAVAGATAYHVQEATDPDFTRPTTITVDKTTSVSFSHTNNACDPVTYYYRMVASSDCGASDISATVDMAVDGSGSLGAPALALPANDAMQVDTDTLLDWDEVSGADAYDVQVCSDRICLTAIRTSTMTEHEWMVTPALDEYTTYTWKARATNGCMDGPWSEVWEFQTGCNLPATPKVLDPGLSAASKQTYVVGWNAVDGATGYTVYEANNPSFLNATSFAASDKETSMAFSHVNTSCTPVTYYYRLVAHSGCGDSELSEPVDMVVSGLVAGEPCSTGLDGVCSQGITECRNDEIVCTQTTQPSAELCDGLDNDCNPATADGFAERWLGTLCDGLDSDSCREGRLTCERGTRTCTDYTNSTKEICGDGIDNDCDGVVDCLGDPIFQDGFESGDSSHWSTAVR